jgi:CobQ-like glutamine amidotransferase family enzyme
MTAPIVIARLLPDLLSINGSSANAEILHATLTRMGHPVVRVDVAGVGDGAMTPDVVCVGSGSTSALTPTLTALLPLASTLQAWAAHGAQWVAVGMGWDVLGQDITLTTGDVLPGVGIFSSSADYRSGRFSGEVSGVDFLDRPTAGYINQVGTSTLHGGEPLMSITHSASPIPPAEGVIEGPLLGTKMGGPLMSLNPHLRDDVLNRVLAGRGLPPVAQCQLAGFQEFHARTETLAQKAREAIAARLR